MRPRSLKVVTRVRDYWPYNGRKLRANKNRVAKRVLFDTTMLDVTKMAEEAAAQASPGSFAGRGLYAHALAC
jgi:hypothetical protein